MNTQPEANESLLGQLLFNRSGLSLWLQRRVLQYVLGGTGLPRSVTVSRTSIGPITGHSVRPAGVPEEHLIIYLPGGGFALGSARTHLPYFSRLCLATGSTGLLINPRLAPRQPYPAAFHDAVRALQWVQDNHMNPDSTVIAGDGSGAGLALCAMLKQRDDGQPLPRGALLVSPWVDLANSKRTLSFSDQGFGQRLEGIRMGYYADMYAGELDPSHPNISPLNADLTGLPPMLIQAGRQEVLAEDSIKLQARAVDHDIESRLEHYPGTRHSLPLFAGSRLDADRLLQSGARFLRDRLGYLDSYH